MAAAVVNLASVFGPLVAGKGTNSIGDLVKNFDFSKIDVKDSSREDYLHVDLAPSFGTLNSESVKAMDEELKVMIAGTMRALGKLEPNERTWKKVVETMMQNPLLVPDTDAVNRADKLIKSGTNVFKFDGSPDSAIVREVKTWFTNLIADKDVLDSTRIDIDVLADIVAQTGATIDSFETIFYKNETHEKTLVDIGVLRFPDIDHPFFKVYHIKLVAWSRSNRVLMVQDDHNGITGEFFSRNFKPRESVIKGLSAETTKKAVQEVEDLFK